MITTPLYEVSWSTEELFAISLPFPLASLPSTPKLRGSAAERSLHHRCTLRKLHGTLTTAAATAQAKIHHCTTSYLLSAIWSDHILLNLLQPLCRVGPSQRNRRLQKEAQQEAPIPSNSFKWFNVYLVPEIGHKLKMQPSYQLSRYQTLWTWTEKWWTLFLLPNSTQDGGIVTRKGPWFVQSIHFHSQECGKPWAKEFCTTSKPCPRCCPQCLGSGV